MTFCVVARNKAVEACDGPLSESMHIYLGPTKMMRTGPFSHLHVSHNDLQRKEGVTPSALLSWQAGISSFAGRDKELRTLEEWALSPKPVSAQWVIGKNGMGKSRLAAEFATRMTERHGWASGFVDLFKPTVLPLDTEGILIVVDHPEENKERVTQLLQGMADIDPIMREKGGKIRVLLLSRQSFSDWQQTIFETGTEILVSPAPLELPDLESDSARQIYHTSFSAALKLTGRQEQPDTENAAEAWTHRSRENRRPQILVTAAVFNAYYPEENVLQFNAREVTAWLALQELSDAEKSASAAGWEDPLVFSILQTMVNIGGSLESGQAERCLARFGLAKAVPEEVSLLSLSRGIKPCEADIFSAAYTAEILGKIPHIAPEILWLSIENNFSAALSRLSRIVYDAEEELGFDKNQLDQWFLQAVSQSPERSVAIEPFFVDDLYGLNAAGIKICQTCLEQTESEKEKMRLFAKLSKLFQASGDRSEALRYCVLAVDICEELASSEPETFEPELAWNYFNLWQILFVTGEKGKAFRVIERTSELFEKLALTQPRKFKVISAQSFDKLQNAYAEAGQLEKALQVSEKALTIYQQMASLQPWALGPALATCFMSQSNIYAQLGETKKALTATRNAVRLYEKLVATQPEVFEPGLAASLHNLATRHADAGDPDKALTIIHQSLQIYERLSTAQPETFTPELAASLSLQGNLLAYIGAADQALEITQRAVNIYSRLARETAIYDSLLASSLNNLSSRYADVGEAGKALVATKTAVSIYESLAETYPLLFDPHLATSLNILGVRYAEMGDTQNAVSATQQAIEIYSQLVVAQPDIFEPDLAGCLNNQGNLFASMGKPEKALAATEMAVEIKEQLAAANPEKFMASLVKSLSNLKKRYLEINEEKKAEAIRERIREIQGKNPDPLIHTGGISLPDSHFKP